MMARWPKVPLCPATGRAGGNERLDQNGHGSCGAEGLTQGCMLALAKATGKPPPLLNPLFMYHTTSGGRDQGSSLQANIAFALKDPDMHVCYAACYALGRIGPAATIPCPPSTWSIIHCRLTARSKAWRTFFSVRKGLSWFLKFRKTRVSRGNGAV